MMMMNHFETKKLTDVKTYRKEAVKSLSRTFFKINILRILLDLAYEISLILSTVKSISFQHQPMRRFESSFIFNYAISA